MYCAVLNCKLVWGLGRQKLNVDRGRRGQPRINGGLRSTQMTGKCALSSLRRTAGVRGHCLVTVRSRGFSRLPNSFCIQTFIGRCTSAIKLSNRSLLGRCSSSLPGTGASRCSRRVTRTIRAQTASGHGLAGIGSTEGCLPAIVTVIVIIVILTTV